MVEIDAIARAAAGLILLWAAGAKVAARTPERLEPYGVPAKSRPVAYGALALAEALVGIGLLVGLRSAAFAAIGLGVAFTLALARVRARGIRSLDCGCFGAKVRPTSVLMLRALAFTGLTAV